MKVQKRLIFGIILSVALISVATFALIRHFSTTESESTPVGPEVASKSNETPPPISESEESEETKEPEIAPEETPEKPAEPAPAPAQTPTQPAPAQTPTQPAPAQTPTPKSNCTTSFGKLMLINPVFTVTTDFISQRKSQLIDLTTKYGIQEGKSSNGRPLMDVEAASHLNDMLKAYSDAHPGHTITTRSCFRAKGTSCGRLCYATGTSDHHSGYTCDLIDSSYGTILDTDLYSSHPEWQWLKQNSYKYGFIDRFPKEWAGGPMSQPVNINEKGSTGLYETWHYRYVGLDAASDIATGKYNNGAYDSLEHYLLARGFVSSLTAGTCK